MPSFADRLKDLRKAKKLTQKNMADYLGITERQYNRYEAGEVDPPTSKTQMLADYFNVPVDYILGRDNYWQDTEGHIIVRISPDDFSEAEKQRIIKRLAKHQK